VTGAVSDPSSAICAVAFVVILVAIPRIRAVDQR
jgi:hypothetical protein